MSRSYRYVLSQVDTSDIYIYIYIYIYVYVYVYIYILNYILPLGLVVDKLKNVKDYETFFWLISDVLIV